MGVRSITVAARKECGVSEPRQLWSGCWHTNELAATATGRASRCLLSRSNFPPVPSAGSSAASPLDFRHWHRASFEACRPLFRGWSHALGEAVSSRPGRSPLDRFGTWEVGQLGRKSYRWNLHSAWRQTNLRPSCSPATFCTAKGDRRRYVSGEFSMTRPRMARAFACSKKMAFLKQLLCSDIRIRAKFGLTPYPR